MKLPLPQLRRPRPAPACDDKVSALPQREATAWLAAGLALRGYREVDPVPGYRVFRKEWSALEFMFLSPEGRLLAAETLVPAKAEEVNESMVVRLSVIGCEALSAELT